jgi:proline iminopeptidase
MKIWKWLAATLPVPVILVLCLLLIPRTYHVPQQAKRSRIAYWNLSTGSKIAYTFIKGKGLKKEYPIIYLQGGPGGYISNNTVEMLRPLSEEGYDIYLYDQIGSGHSERLTNITEYTAERHKRDLEEIVKIIKAKKIILIGQSWGAILAVLFAADNQYSVDKIIFTGPGPIIPVKIELAELKAPDGLNLIQPPYSNSTANQETNNYRTKFVMRWAFWFGAKLASDQEMDDFQTLLNDKLNKSTVCDTTKARQATGGGGYYVQMMTLYSFSETPDPRPKLKNNHIPVLVMRGQCDNQKWGFTNEYLTIFENHKLVVIPSAGHDIFIEQPAIYLQTIRHFLKD